MLSPYFISTFCLLVIVAGIATVTGRTTTHSPPTSPSSVGGLTITSTVPAIVPGITDHAAVKCSFSRSRNLQIASVISLILSRWVPATESSQELLAITTVNPDQVKVQQNVGDKVKGQLNQNGESFLSVEWDYPSKDAATTYTCSVNTIDSMGHPIISTVGLEVRHKAADFSTLAEALRRMREQQRNQSLKLDTQENEIKAQNEIDKNLTDALEKQKNANHAQLSAILNLSHDLKEQEQTDRNLTEALEKQKNTNAAQENVISKLRNDVTNQDKVDKNLTAELQKRQSTNAAQDSKINSLISDMSDQKALSRNLTRDVNGFRTLTLDFNDSLLRVHDRRCRTSNVTIDRKKLYWCMWPMTFEQAKVECIVTGGKMAEFGQDKLNAVKPQLKAAGMGSSFGFWVGVTRNGASKWVFNSTGGNPGTIVWDSTPSTSYGCAYFRIDRSGYSAHLCTFPWFPLCARDE